MKHGIQLLLALTLAVAPWGCNRDRSNNDSVSANSDDSAQQTSPEPAKRDLRDQTNQSTPSPAYKAPQSTPKQQSTRKQSTSRDTRSEDRVREDTDSAAVVDRAEPTARTASTATLPAGTKITVTMIDSVSTDTNSDGDTFSASLIGPLTVNGKVLADKGARVQGRIQNVVQPGKVKGKAQLELVLTKLTTGGKTYNIDTEPFVATAADSKERDAGVIAGGAGVGAVIGAVAGGKKGAAIGAIIGGGSGTTAVLMTKGKDLKIEPETRVNFVTQSDVRLPVLRNVAS